MRIKVLGSAAGGGFPQWNCACRNCSRLRERTLNASARSQSQIAVSSNGHAWFLLNASPDLRAQIEATPELHSQGQNDRTVTTGSNRFRYSPIAGIVLTGGELDQVLGLLLLRELEPIQVYCTDSVRRLLREHNIFFNMLSRVPGQSAWTDIVPGESFRLAVPETASDLICQPVPLRGSFPAYVDGKSTTDLRAKEAVLGLVIEPSHESGRLAYFPSVPKVDDRLVEVFESCDLLLFDGTFWTDDELAQVHGSFSSATDMGHLPISGPAGSLSRLAKLRRPRKIFVHINNTNPILDRDSLQYRQVTEAGWEVAEDGWDFKLRYPKQVLAS